MQRDEAAHRDGVLRAYFVGRDWDRNPEFVLKREFVARSVDHLPEYPLVWDDEWEVDPGHSGLGKGDLVLTDGAGRFAVVEFKFLNPSRGATARKSRNKARTHVEEQAARYAARLQARFPRADVRAFSFTDERGLAAHE